MQRVFKIAVNGTNYDVVVEELTSATSAIMPNYTPAPVPASAPAAAAPAAAPKAAAPAPAGAGDQCAQMGGVVSGVNVKEGQQVNEGDKIAELEAMKMKVPVMASRSGQVSKVCVAVGDAVEAGQVLLTIA
jgi:biotin carboxyl carrier protein